MDYTVKKAVIEEFRDGIFALRTRRFGTVAEIMIKQLYHLDESGTLAFDKIDRSSKQYVEIKFSTVMKTNNDTICDDNVIEQCKKANLSNRAMKSNETKLYRFDCNIQQIKCKEFDVLYYGLFFADQIEIYKMTSAEVKKYSGYSDKQHRGNKGEGQFHINKSNIEYHREHYLQKTLTYKELYDLLRKNMKD